MITKWNFRYSILVGAFFFGLLFLNPVAYADTYDVSAVVPFEVPSQAADVDHPNGGVSFHNAQQTVTGDCQVQNPTTIVSIWRSSVVLGSTECVSGRFSISIGLQLGSNHLVARTANANGIYGPDSTVFTWVLLKPIVAEPLPPETNQPTTTKDYTAATNQAGISGLSLTTAEPFSVLPTTKVATVSVIVAGGQQPYTLQLKWGDGSTESHSLTESGTYNFTHTYLVHKTYTVYAGLRDVLGAYSEYVYAVVAGVSSRAESNTDSSTTSKTQRNEPWRLIGTVWYYWLILIFVVGFLIYIYFMGYHRGREQTQIEAQRKIPTKKPRRKPTKK